MSGKSVLVAIGFLLTALMVEPVLAGSPFSLRGLQPGQMTMTGHYDDEKTRATYTVTRETHQGKPCLRAVWDSSIKKIDMWMWLDGTPIRSRYQRSKDGISVQIEYTPSGASYRYTDKGETETFQIEQKNLVESLALDLLLVAYPFDKGGEVVFYGIDADSDDGDVYKFYVELDEVETIQAMGKKVKAFKVEMSLKGFVGLFAPTYYFWYSCEKPHRYLKYEGPDEEFVITGGELSL
jgi:hypothetical protein